MEKLKFVKTGASFIVSVGVGAIVGNMVKHTTPGQVTKIMKIFISAGSLALTGFASDKMARYTEKTIDDVAKAVKNAFTEDEEDSGGTKE